MGGLSTPQTSKTPQKRQNSSTLGHDHTVKNNARIILLDTIEEPMARGFQNTPYLNQSDNLSTFGVCPKFVIFSKICKISKVLKSLKIHDLLTSTKCAKIITLIEVRGVLKTSCQWLFNGVKQNNPNIIFDCMIMA